MADIIDAEFTIISGPDAGLIVQPVKPPSTLYALFAWSRLIVIGGLLLFAEIAQSFGEQPPIEQRRGPAGWLLQLQSAARAGR